MSIRKRLLAGLAGQLRHPRGVAGRAMGSMLNRANRAAVTAALDALAPRPDQVVADIGFGGGLGLALLLDRLGTTGRVHGVDISRVMLDRVRRRHRHAVADGRLVLHEASMTDLPLADASVDAAMTVNTIYFVPDNAFAELARIISPTGRLVLGLGDPDAMARDPVTAHAFRLRPLAEVRAAAVKASASQVMCAVAARRHAVHQGRPDPGTAAAAGRLEAALDLGVPWPLGRPRSSKISYVVASAADEVRL